MDFSALNGRLITAKGLEPGEDEVVFTDTESGEQFVLSHTQDCCECVRLYDVCGDPDDLIDARVISAYESSSGAEEDVVCESCTWTFYRIQTSKGAITLRWLGESNGYYSEDVEFDQVK